MSNKILLMILSLIIILIMIFGNKKVFIWHIIKKQVEVFKDARTGKIAIWDIICFIILPILLAGVFTIGLDCNIDEELATVLTTVFAFTFTVLFGFAAILVGKLDSKNKIEKQVVGETFVSIMTSNILSLCASILSVAIIVANDVIVETVLSICIYSLSFMMVMLLLMISKRTLIIYCNNIGNR